MLIPNAAFGNILNILSEKSFRVGMLSKGSGTTEI